jgi:putative RNA 2'-phosphotransferase
MWQTRWIATRPKRDSQRGRRTSDGRRYDGRRCAARLHPFLARLLLLIVGRMNDKRKVFLSKFLAKHLRHEPHALGLTLMVGGWVPVADLIEGAARQGVTFSLNDLQAVVESNDKQRYAFDDTGAYIRANQGHSVPVDLQLEAAEPPSVLYHGTAAHNIALIRAEGLKAMRRHHVHLSTDIETAARVGARYSRPPYQPPAIFEVAALTMHAENIIFYVSANGVWLTEQVPPRYLTLLP